MEEVLNGKVIYTKDDDWEFEYSNETKDKDEAIGLILDGIDMILDKQLQNGDKIIIKIERNNKE
jgi:hypothetical protein